MKTTSIGYSVTLCAFCALGCLLRKIVSLALETVLVLVRTFLARVAWFVIVGWFVAVRVN